jgi:hypothetical protein
MTAERRLLPALLFGLSVLAGCAGTPAPVNPELLAAAERQDALATSDALEALIERGADTAADRKYAYDEVRKREQGTAAYAFARAAVTGRLVQQRGLRGSNLVGEVERWALRSRELDPGFRDGAATRLLGTLYVISPATFLESGDSETGLELLEQLVQERPDVVENQLRLAEAYVSLGDPGPAAPHLCECLARREQLRRDDRALLDALVKTAGTPDCDAEP